MMMTKKITGAIFLPLLFAVSPIVNATYSYSPCPAGTTGSSVGTGVIDATGAFIPSSPGFGRTVYFCSPVTTTSSSSNQDSHLQETTTNTLQIERSTYNTINQHLMSKVVREYTSDIKLNKGAASADSNSYAPDSVWGESNISSLTEHNKNVPGFATNIYQFNGGLDKRYGDLFFGAALTYAYTDNNLVNNTDNVMHTVGITPYVAYKINDYLFASGLASYYYSNTSGSAGRRNIDTHDYSGEANINAFKVIDAFTLKARAGLRYKHAYASQKGALAGSDSSFDEITGIVDAQVDYRFDNGLTLYTGALYNHYARELSRVSNLVRGNDVVWMRYGAEYPITKGFLLGAKIENDLNDKDTNYLTGSVNFRLEL